MNLVKRKIVEVSNVGHKDYKISKEVSRSIITTICDDVKQYYVQIVTKY